MFSLLVDYADGRRETFTLRGLRLTIGRSARNEICIPDPFASRVHAEVRGEAGSYVLQDLGSANGTYFEGKAIREAQVLVPDARFRIGETIFTFVETVAAKTLTHHTPAAQSVTSFTTSLPARRSTTAKPVDEATNNDHTSGLLEAIEAARRTNNNQGVGSSSSSSSSSGNQNNARQSTTKPRRDVSTFADDGGISNSSSSGGDANRNDLLALISKVGVTLLASATLDESLNQIVTLVFEAVPAERCMIMLRAEASSDNSDSENPIAPKLEVRAAAKRERTTSFSGKGNITQLETGELKVSRTVIAEVLTRGASILATDAQHDPRFINSTMTLEGIRSVLAVPLGVGSDAFGIIYADSPIETVAFTDDHLKVLTTLASVAAIRVENARLIEQQLERERLEREVYLAREIQQRFQPSSAPLVEGYDLVGISFSCYEIGGDYYDFILRPENRCVVALGDVSGKGTAAALLMSSLHAAIHAQACVQTSLVETITAVNEYLAANIPSNRFITLFYSELDAESGNLSFVNAGHNPALIVRAAVSNQTEAPCEQLTASGIPLGISAAASYSESRTHLAYGDVLVMYSDGVTETNNERGEEFGIARLLEVITQNLNQSAAGIRDRIEAALTRFAGDEAATDDVTMVIVKRQKP